MTGPILGPSVPAGAATGNLVASYSQYDALEASEAGSSRGDEEEGLVRSKKAGPRAPWYKDCQVGCLIRHPVAHQQFTPALKQLLICIKYRAECVMQLLEDGCWCVSSVPHTKITSLIACPQDPGSIM